MRKELNCRKLRKTVFNENIGKKAITFFIFKKKYVQIAQKAGSSLEKTFSRDFEILANSQIVPICDTRGQDG